MRLTEKIQAITKGSVDDGYGGTTPSTIIEFEAWASVEQLKTSKNIEQAQLSLPSTFRVRTRKEFRKDHIVNWRGKEYSIVSVPQVDEVRRTRFYVFDIHALTL